MPSTRLRRFPLSPADTAWFRMEVPTNLMMITGVFLFEEPLLLEKVRGLIEKRLLIHDRFRMRVTKPRFALGQPFWEPDPTFDISAHLHRIALPAPGDQETLQRLVNDFMSTPLDFTKPLWQIHLVESYGEGCALLCRLHHCIADGIALMKVLLTLTDEEPDSELPSGEPDTSAAQTTSAVSSRNDTAAAVPRGDGRVLARMAQEWRKAMGDPSRAVNAARFGAESSAALAHLLLLSADPETPFKGKLGVAKRCAWSQPIPLSHVKAVRRVANGTVNDVLLAAVSGALGRYLRLRGETIGGLSFRAVVPVNLRPQDEELKLGNAFGLIFLSLPVGISDPLDRLTELKRRMDAIKGTPEAMVAFGILNAMGISHSQVQETVVKIFGQKATTVMTNVPGPREVRYFAGKPIRGIMFWVPQSGRLGLGVSILSYAGEVLVGVATDAGLVPDPENIVEAFHVEFGDLMELVRMAEEADAETTTAGATPVETERCRAQTAAGRRCKNKARPGSPYCHVHKEREAA